MTVINKFATKEEAEMVEQIVKLLKEHPNVKELFEHYNIPLDDIENIPIEFADMDVSAKTKDGKITINKALVEDKNFIEDLHYIVHEMVHVLQQKVGKNKEYGDLSCVKYLDNPLEIEAFKQQISFIEKYKSLADADEYLDKLLNFHELDGTERKRKRNELRGA